MTRRRTSSPSIPGIFRSRTITSGMLSFEHLEGLFPTECDFRIKSPHLHPFRQGRDEFPFIIYQEHPELQPAPSSGSFQLTRQQAESVQNPVRMHTIQSCNANSSQFPGSPVLLRHRKAGRHGLPVSVTTVLTAEPHGRLSAFQRNRQRDISARSHALPTAFKAGKDRHLQPYGRHDHAQGFPMGMQAQGHSLEPGKASGKKNHLLQDLIQIDGGDIFVRAVGKAVEPVG